RPGRLRPRQPLLSRLGPDLTRRGSDAGLASGMGPRRRGPGRLPREAGSRAGDRAPTRHRDVGLGRLRRLPLMATVRYLVNDVPRAVSFYVERLGFEVEQQMLPAFARVHRTDLTLWLAGPASSAARPMPDGNPIELFEARR